MSCNAMGLPCSRVLAFALRAPSGGANPPPETGAREGGASFAPLPSRPLPPALRCPRA
eukprot:CAMPEP_0171287666 /NCGR_PEP_ID=MMETSP0790-20130122/69688_1 /TAXON_ID=2925 /ORGANISM="Alexandrium catenella, Strain OF101" /LENGTH=57 /DNA_ID=CAMNT_0011757233 /DNA_START=10 /DNA_END=180 /DNA_ORIENTATION=-